MSDEDQKYQLTSHFIDYRNDKIADKTDLAHENLPIFINNLIHTMLNNVKRDYKYYKIISESTELISLVIRDFLRDHADFPTITRKIAMRLLDKESKAQERYGHLKDIVQGDLIQYFDQSEDYNIYMAIKLQHNEFYSAADYKLISGFPKDKYVKKTCLIKFSLDNEILEILVSDTNSKISDYWWDDFLELEECNTDEHNTEIAINSIDDTLTRNLKKQSPYDYTIIRNSVISYFKNNESLSYNEMVDSLFENYQPEEPTKFNIKELTAKIRELPDKKEFDKTFNVIQNYVTKRARKTYPISENIVLKIEGALENIKDQITGIEKPDHTKYLVIRTDDETTFNFFNKRE